MPISELSPVTNADPGLSVLNQPTAVSPSATQPAAVVAKSALVASSPTTESAPLATAPKATIARKGGGGSAGAGSSSTLQLITDTYTTTVAGKSYFGSVQQEPGGQYVASVPSLSGATASGSSIEAVENALGSIINALA